MATRPERSALRFGDRGTPTRIGPAKYLDRPRLEQPGRRCRDAGATAKIYACSRRRSTGRNAIEVEMLRLIALAAVIIVFLAAGVQA
jgi:hypothetical protein